MADQTPDAMMYVGVEAIPGDIEKLLREVSGLTKAAAKNPVAVKFKISDEASAQATANVLMSKVISQTTKAYGEFRKIGVEAKRAEQMVENIINEGFSAIIASTKTKGGPLASAIESAVFQGLLEGVTRAESKFAASQASAMGRAGKQSSSYGAMQNRKIQEYEKNAKRIEAETKRNQLGPAAPSASQLAANVRAANPVFGPAAPSASQLAANQRAILAENQRRVRATNSEFSRGSINSLARNIKREYGLYGEALFQAADHAIDDMLARAGANFGVGSARYRQVESRLQRAFGKDVESRRLIGRASIDAMTQQVLESMGGAAGTSVGAGQIRESLRAALADRHARRGHLEGRVTSGTATSQEREDAFKARQDVSELERRLQAVDRIEREKARIQEKIERNQGSRFFGGMRGNILNRQMEQKNAEMQKLYGGGPMGGKTSAHGAQFAAMNAAYGFQDFFQVLAQPGMGPGRAFLAAANNIGPAMAMIGGSAVGATVAIGGLMGVMAAMNYVLDKSEKKSHDLAKRFSELADRINKAAVARADFDINTKPSGESTGAAGWSKLLSEAIGSGLSAKGLSESAGRGFLSDERTKSKKWAGGDTIGSAFADKWSKWFSVGGDVPDSELEMIYPKPKPEKRFKKTGKKTTAPAMPGGASPDLFFAPTDAFEYVDIEHGLSDALAAYEKFWAENGPGQKIKKQIEDAGSVIKSMSRVSDSANGIVAEIVAGADQARQEGESLGSSGRGMFEKYVNSALNELPGNQKALSEMSQSATAKRSQWEKENGQRLSRLQEESRKKSRTEMLAKGSALPETAEDHSLLKNAPRRGGLLSVRQIEREASEKRAETTGLQREKESIDSVVSAIEKIKKQAADIPKGLMEKDGAGRVIAENMIPGFDSSGFSSSGKARKETASGLAEFAKIADVMPESEKEFFRMRTSITQFGDSVANQRMRLTKIYSELDKFQATNLGKDAAANANFGRSQIFEAGSVFGFDVETAKQKMDAASRSSDSFSEAISRIGKQSNLTGQELKSMQNLREAGLIEKKRLIEASDPIEKSVQSVHKYREALAGFDASMKEYALRASASGGKWTEPEAKLAKFEEVAAKLGVTLSFNDQFADFTKMVKDLKAAADSAGVSPQRKKEINEQLDFMGAEMLRNNPAEVARREAMGGRASMFGPASNRASNLSDSLALIRERFDHQMKQPGTDVDAVKRSKNNAILNELEQFASSVAGFNLSTSSELERFDLAIKEMIDQMQKENVAAKDVAAVKAAADRKRAELLWANPNEAARRSAMGGREGRFAGGSSAAAENFTDQLKLMAEEFGQYLKTTDLDAVGTAAARQKHARDIDRFIADFAESLGVVPTFKEKIDTFDASLAELIKTMKANKFAQADIERIQNMGDRQRRQMQRESDSAKAERGALGGRPDEYRYGNMRGGMLNFFDRIRSMQMDLASELDNPNLSDKDKVNVRTAHERRVQSEISGLGLGGTGRTQMIDSGSLWDKIQGSLGGNEMLDAERRQVEILTRIHEALVGGKMPSGAAGRMYGSFMGGAEPAAVGHDFGGYAGSGKKPSARDTILAKLREGEVVLTPEHQARIAQRLKMSPADLFGGMGMTHKGSSLSAWANVGGFDGGGLVGGMRFSSMLDGGFRKWQKRQDAQRNYANRQWGKWDDEEPFRERYAEYGRQSAHFGMSGFYRNQGVPLYGRGAGGQGGRTLSGPKPPSFDEAWPGGMPFISAPGTSLGLPRSGRAAASFEEMNRQKNYGLDVSFKRSRGDIAKGEANSMQLAEMKRRGMSSRSVDVMAGVQAGSAERAAEARRQQALVVQRQAEQAARKGEFQEKAKADEQERLARKSAAQKEAAEKTERAKADYRKRLEEAKAAVKSGKGFDGGEGEDPEAKAARLEAGRERLRKKADEKWAPKEEYVPFSSHHAGESKEKNRKETLGEKLVRENEERFSKFEKENPSSGGGPGSSAGMTPGEKALKDQKDRLNRWRGGLGSRMEESFPVFHGEIGDTPPESSRTVRGGDRLGRWRAGQEDDKKMREEGNRLQMDAYKNHFDGLQNVSGKEQAASGVGFGVNDRNTAVLERIAETLITSSRDSVKASDKVVSAIEGSGISIS